MERQSTRKLFKLVIALVALFTLALSVFAFGACGGEEHKHVYESTGTKTAANCGKIGVETFTCSCGDTYVAVTPATGSHSWGADGYCQTCGLPNFGAEGIDYSKIPDSFTAEDLDAIKAAITASQKGITDAQAEAHKKYDETLKELGGKVDDVQGSINALETLHKFDKTGAVKELTLDGTCTTYGVKFTLSTCDICGATFLTGIAKNAEVTGHKYVKDAARSKDPVCGIPGVDVFECSVCKDTYSVSVIPENPDLTHKIDESSKQTVIEATCQRTGLVYYTCSLCGVTVSQQTPKTDHQADTSKDKTIVPATCLTDGEVEHTCKNCDEKWRETIEALGHQQADDPVIYDCTYNSPLNGYYCTREGCDNEYVAESVLREALKEGEEVKFHQPLKHLTDAEFETTYKKAAHEYVYGNFSQDELCGSDASYTIECPNCHEFTDHGEFTITAEYWFKNGVKDWDPDFTAFLFKTEGSDYEDREGDAYRPAHTHDAAATLQVEYVLREFVSNEEWNSLNPVNDGPNKHTVMKTAYYACKDCSFANDAKDGSVIKDALAEENAVPEVYKDLMEKKSEKHTMTPLWKNDVDKGVAIPQTVLDALEDKYCDWDDLLFPRDANGVQQITDDVVTLNVHHNVTVSWYCTDTTCNDGHPATYTHTYKWTGTHTWGDDWQNTWTAEDAISHGWTLVEGTETEDTCTVGVWMRQCTNKSCPDVKEYNTVAPRHKFADDDTHKVTPATCTTEGKESGTCEACGKTMEDVVIPPLGHNFKYESEDEGWTTVTPAGHGNKGLEHRPCLRCHGELEGGWEPRDIPETNDHTWVVDEDGNPVVFVTCEPSCDTAGSGYWKCKECPVLLTVSIPATGHWYYDISPEEAAELGLTTAELERDHLNRIGEQLGNCLTPKLSTVACVYCGVRYNTNGDDLQAPGHKFVVVAIDSTDSALCGTYPTTEFILKCTECGYYFEVDRTLKALEDYDFDALKVNDTLEKVEGDVQDALWSAYGLSMKYLQNKETNAPWKDELVAATEETDPSETPEPTVDELVIALYTSKEMQLHDFHDGIKLYVTSDNNCNEPSAYVILCSRCGGTKADPIVKADTELNEKYWEDGMVPLKNKLGDAGAYDKLGYKWFDKEKKYTVEGKTEKVSEQDLYIDIVSAYLVSIEELEEGKTVARNNVYTGYNFSGFTYKTSGHDYFFEDRAECVIDPILSFIFEDYIGVSAGKPGIVWTTNTAGFVQPNANAMYGTAFEKGEEGEWNTLGECITAIKSDPRAAAFCKAYENSDWADVSFGEYAEVFAYLNAKKPSITALPDGYKGISNWCERAAEENNTCTLPGGFVVVGEHTPVYQVGVLGKNGKLSGWDEVHFFTYDKNGSPVTQLPTQAQVNAMIEDNTFDIRLIQYLYNNKATLEAENNGGGNSIYNSIKNAGVPISYVLSADGRLTCMTRLTCKFHDQCNFESVAGDHAMPDASNPDDLANCQHADRCVACGDYYDGSVIEHKLVLFSDLAEDLQTWLKSQSYFSSFGVNLDGDPTCFNHTGDTIKICEECVKAAKAGNWQGAKAKTKASDLTGSTGEKALAPKGWVSEEGNLSDDPRGINWSPVPADSIAHTYQLSGETDDTTLAALGKLYNEYLADKEVAEGAPAEKVKATVDTLTAAIFNFLNKKGGFVYDETNKIATRSEGTRFTTAYTLETVKIDEDGCLVYTVREEAAPDKTFGYCTGAATESEYHLCYVCLLANDGVYNIDTTVTGHTTWKLGVEFTVNDTTTKHGTVTAKGTTGADGGTAKNTPVTTPALYHVYAPSANQANAKEGSINLYCLRCQTNANNTYDQLSKKVANKGVVFYTDKSAFESDQSNPLVPDHSALVWDETKISGDVKISVGGKDVLSDLDNATGVVAATLKNSDEIAEAAALEVKKGVDLTLTIPEGATVKATNGISVTNGGSLVIKGGEIAGSVDLLVKAEEGNESGTTLTLEGTTISSSTKFGIDVNKPKDATAGKDVPITVDIKDSRIQGRIGLFVNGQMDNVTLNITNSAILGDNGCGLSVCGKTKVVAENSVFFGAVMAVQMASGTGTFTNCTFVSAGDKFTNDDGSENTCFGENTEIPNETKGTFVINHRSAGYDYPVSVTLKNNEFITATMPEDDNAWRVGKVFAAKATGEQTAPLNWKDSAGEAHSIGYYEENDESDEMVTVAIVDANPDEQTSAYVTITTDVKLGLQLGKNVFIYSNGGTSDRGDGSHDSPAVLNNRVTIEVVRKLITLAGTAQDSIAPKAQP